MSDLSKPNNLEKKVEKLQPQKQVQPQREEVSERKGKKKFLVPLVIILSIVLILILGYIAYIQFFKDDTVNRTDDTQQEQEDLEEDTETEDLVENDVTDSSTEDNGDIEEEEDDGYTTFTGELLTAQLPEGWSIIEYFDGDGTESLPDMGLDYEGFTAMDIISPDNRQVFTLQAVSGIGFAGCPSYALFDDDSESYRFEQESMSADMGETLNITDYTGQEYSEFEFLGVTFRRIDDKYFYDMREGNNYFEPPCVEGLLTLEGLFFTDTDGTIYEAYFYGPTGDATEEDLIVVDEILESIEII
jgi:hypothetical protein